jgi:hypothetical protein
LSEPRALPPAYASRRAGSAERFQPKGIPAIVNLSFCEAK